MTAPQERGHDCTTSGRKYRSANARQKGEYENEHEWRVEHEQDRDRANDDGARNIAPEHRASRPHGISDRAAEEAEERVRDARDAHGEGRQQRGLGRPVGDVRERDQRDRITEPTDDLSQPEECEVRGADVMRARLRLVLDPDEWDE